MNAYSVIKVRDREIGLFYSVGAAIDIADLMGGEIEKLGEYLQNIPSGEIVKRTVNLVEILNRWYAEETETEPITRKKIMNLLDVNDMEVYINAILDAIGKGTKVSIETKEVKNAASTGGNQ